MAARDGSVGYDRLHHFIASGAWDSEPVGAVLLAEADKMVGDAAAWLIIDDTAFTRPSRRSPWPRSIESAPPGCASGVSWPMPVMA